MLGQSFLMCTQALKRGIYTFLLETIAQVRDLLLLFQVGLSIHCKDPLDRRGGDREGQCKAGGRAKTTFSPPAAVKVHWNAC